MQDRAGRHPMYGLTSGKRAMYCCAEYMKSGGAFCHHNQFDAEALLKFMLQVFKQQIILKAGGREALWARLLEKAQRAASDRGPVAASDLDRLSGQLAKARQDLERISKNLAMALDEAENQAIKPLFREKRAEVDRLTQEMEKCATTSTRAPGVQDEVDAALGLFDQIVRIVEDPQARPAIRPLLVKLNVRIWLNFKEGLKKTRKIRLLTGGVIAMGDTPDLVSPICRRGSGSDGKMNLSSGETFSPPAEGEQISSVS